MSGIEIAAVLLGLINVGLIIRRSIWNYPFGLLMVVLYAKIFFDAQLYSDALLQVYFLLVQLYGWWNWNASRAQDGLVRIGTLSPRARLMAACATLALWLVLGGAMARWTDAAFPFWDAAIAALSVTAQLLLSLRRIETWPLWIAVDCLAIGLFTVKELHLTAGLYALFLVLAVTGLLQWQRRLAPA